VRGSVYLKTLHDLRGSTLAWSVGVAAIAAVNVLFFPTIQNMEGLVAFLDGLPEVFKAMIGDVSAMVQLEGFLRVKLFDPLPLLLAIFGVSHGATSLAGEVDHKHVDLLLARPIRRSSVVVAKFLAVATSLLAIVIATTVVVVGAAPMVTDQADLGHLVLSTLNSLPLSWLFAALAVLASSLAKHPRSAALAAGAIVVASYVLETLRLLSPALASWRPVSLFAYHKASYPLTGPADLVALFLLLLVTAALLVAAVATWERRDLAS
jgi:ABC-2 type transport system permease protein